MVAVYAGRRGINLLSYLNKRASATASIAAGPALQPMVAWASFPRESLVLLSGELTQIRHAERLRSFASCCGTPLFFQDAEDSRVDRCDDLFDGSTRTAISRCGDLD